MDQLSDFLNYQYASEILMGIGIVLGVVSTLRVMKSSLALIFWFALAIVGGGTFMYGFKNSDYDALAGIKDATLSGINGLSTDTPSDVLQVLCEKLEGLGLDVANR